MLSAFFAYYAPHRRLLAIDLACSVLSGVLSLGFPLAVAAFVDVLLPAQDWPLLLMGAAGLVLAYLVNTGLMAVITYWGHVLGIRIETELRRRAFEHLQTLSFSFYDNQKTGHLIARVTKDLEEIGEVAHHGPEDLVIAVMTFFAAIALMATIHGPLTLVTLAIVPLVVGLVLRYGRAMTLNWQAQFGRVGAFNARIEDNIGGMRVVQAFANEAHERALFAVENERYRTTKLEAYRIIAASLALNFLGLRLVQVLVLIAGAWFVADGSLTTGGFVGFLLLVTVFYQPIEKIAAVVETYPKGIAGFRRYLDLLATKADIADRPGARAVDALRGDIRFEGVGFAYDGGPPVLDGLDLVIRAGETVAFVGESGAGKTTLCALLPRFYDVTAGRITIDGIDIRDMTLASLRRHIGIVQQDVFLFADTLRANIAYGRLDADEAAILAAARSAKLESLIAQLPDGLDTVVGERGVKLSGGQKQRVAIARAFLKNPPILILDEATSALDTETELAIRQSLDELSKGRTTLVIAHRLETIRTADHIAVVAGGRIVEWGDHDDLVARDGAYRRLNGAGAVAATAA